MFTTVAPNINRGHLFPFTQQATIDFSGRITDQVDKSANSLYPPFLDDYRNKLVHGAPLFAIKGVDGVQMSNGTAAAAAALYLEGNHQKVRTFVNGVYTRAGKRTQNRVLQMVLLDQHTTVLGVAHQGIKDSHQGSQLAAVFSHGALNLLNNSNYPVAVGDDLYWCYPDVGGKSGSIPHGIPTGKHLIIGPAAILGGFRYDHLLRETEVDAHTAKLAHKVLDPKSPVDVRGTDLFTPVKWEAAMRLTDLLILMLGSLPGITPTETARLLTDPAERSKFAQLLLKPIPNSSAIVAAVRDIKHADQVSNERLVESLQSMELAGNIANCLDARSNALEHIKRRHFIGRSNSSARPDEIINGQLALI